MRTGQGPGTLRRSVRNSQRSADSGFDPYYEPGLSHSYSDTDCRYAQMQFLIQHKPQPFALIDYHSMFNVSPSYAESVLLCLC